MREFPILFAGPLVREIRAGRKTETRRLLSPQPPSQEAVRQTVGDGYDLRMHAEGHVDVVGPVEAVRRLMPGRRQPVWRSPYGVAGDRLWVRETWRTAACLDDKSPTRIAEDCLGVGYTGPWAPIWYRADDTFNRAVPRAEAEAERAWGGPGRWRPSIHMPRWASRLTLRVEDVRVERLQAIDEEGARAEGVQDRAAFAALWDGLAGPGASWADDPWVWVVRFEREAL